MHLFYSTDVHNDRATLSAEESVHCIRVLRMKRGDQLNIIDGKGHLYEGYIQDPDPSECRIIITRTELMHVPRNAGLHIAIAPTKSIDRFEWFIEKSIEVGIDAITPVICERSERRILKKERIDKLVIATMKQAMVFIKPEIHDLTELPDLIETLGDTYPCRYIAHCDPVHKKFLTDVFVPGKDSIILIGPEGDFTPSEIKLAIENGFSPVSLGNNRLRTETAGFVAAVLANTQLAVHKS